MAKKVDTHYTVRVHVFRVDKEVDDYTGKTTERSSEEIVSLTVRAATLNKVIDKAQDHLYSEKVDEDDSDVSQALGANLSVPQ